MAERTYHQDYIARIRYSNTLPPPPGPPKLLNIPGTGLGDGRYTSAAFAARMAREELLNIEVDAELGMPIDLIGLPGALDGNESAHYTLPRPPPIHPHDRALLTPASMLGKRTNAEGISFLRRSEVLSAADTAARREAARLRAAANAASAANGASRKKQRVDDEAANDPSRIAKDIEKGFWIANQDSPWTSEEPKPSQSLLNMWNKPVHPDNPDLKMLDSYPILPDLAAVPDLGSYTVAKFQANPLGGGSNKYDTRLDVAIIRPKDPPQEKMDEYEIRKAAHELDPKSAPDPGPPAFDYDLYLLEKESEVAETKRQIADDANATGLENGDAEREPRAFNHVRMYETYQQNSDLSNPFNDTVAIALHDAKAGSARPNLPKGAYLYPIAQRTYIRASRGYQAPKFSDGEQEEPKIDAISLKLRPANEAERELRARVSEQYGPPEVLKSTEA